MTAIRPPSSCLLKLPVAPVMVALLFFGAPAASADEGVLAIDDVDLLIPFASTSIDSPAAYPYGLRSQRSLQLATGESVSGNPANDVSQNALINVYGSARAGSGVDLNASYVWESSRFGQFVLNTRATYAGASRQLDAVRDAAATSAAIEAAAASLTQPGDLQSSLTLTWQIGNHQATATTHYVTDSIDDFGQLSMDQLDELVGYIAALDLSYGYNLRTGRGGNALFSVGLRSTVDRRPLIQLQSPRARGPESNGRAAYGTIRYQF